MGGLHTPSSRELRIGVLLTLPGIAGVALFEAVPIQVLVRPDLAAGFFIGSLWHVELGALGFGLLYVLYYMGLVAIIVSLISLAREK